MNAACIIIDDEPLAIEVIRNHLEKLGELELKGSFTSPVEAARYLRDHRVDLIFLDIEMPHIDGFELLSSLTSPPRVIITTAHRDYAPEAFNMEVLDYLLKPVSFDRFLRAINKFHVQVTRERAQQDRPPETPEGFLIIKSGKHFNKIFFSDILFLESMDDFIRIHTGDKKFDCYERLVSMERKLPSDRFMRIHRAFIVNLDKVDSFTATSVQAGQRTLVIGKTYRDAVLPVLQSGEASGTGSS